MYRWWDGRTWCANVAYVHEAARAAGHPLDQRRPRLPAWLSLPVLIAGGPLLPLIALTVLQAPVVLLLALVPLAFIIPVLLWLDRLEPEPWTSRLHTFLWGGTIAVLVSGTFNVAVLLAVGEAASAVISAPIVEESMKGLGILWAVRRREVDGPVDGVLAETFVAVFVSTIVMVVLVRRAERRTYLTAMPHLAHRCGVPPEELGWFRSWGEMLSYRRRLPRPQRRRFDETHAALARLAALYARAGGPDPFEEQRLARQLHTARAAMSPSTGSLR